MLLAFIGCSGEPPETPGPVETDTPVETGTRGGGPPTADGALSLHPDMKVLVVARWEQQVASERTWLSFRVDGVERTSPVVTRGVGPAEEVVLGVPAETGVEVTLHVEVDGADQPTDLGRITTGALPPDLDDPRVGPMDPSRHRSEPWLLGSVDVGPNPFFGPCFTVILDLQGRVVWYRKTSENRLTWQPRVSRRGGYVLVDESNTYNGSLPEVTRLTLDLRREESVRLPYWGVAYDELDDGTILYDEARTGTEFYLAKVAPDGLATRLWACWPWMSPWSGTFWDCSPNTVQFSPERGTVLWSMFQTSTVVELDLEGRIVAEYGEYPGGHAFVPEASAFELQHFPNFTADGTLIASTHSVDQREQWVREYRVDDGARTLTEVWSARSPEWAEYAGQAQKLPSGQVLWQLGTTGVIRELARDGDVVWEVSWPGHLVGNVTPVADLYALTTGW